jgi:hypothetical protein
MLDLAGSDSLFSLTVEVKNLHQSLDCQRDTTVAASSSNKDDEGIVQLPKISTIGWDRRRSVRLYRLTIREVNFIVALSIHTKLH